MIAHASHRNIKARPSAGSGSMGAVGAVEAAPVYSTTTVGNNSNYTVTGLSSPAGAVANTAVRPAASIVAPAAPQGGINAGYVAGGIAAAGLAADAYSRNAPQRAEDSSLLGQIGDGIISATDAAANFAGNAVGVVMNPMLMMPYMFGSMAVQMALPKDGAAKGIVGKAAGKMDGVLNASFSTAGKLVSPTFGATVAKGIENSASFAAPVLDRVAKIPGLGGLHSENLKTVPQAIGKTSISHGVMQTAFTGGAILNVYGVARGAGAQWSALMQMNKDLTGQDVSSFTLLTSNELPKPVLEARKKFLVVSGAHVFAAVAGLAIQLKFSKIHGSITNLSERIGIGRLGAVGGGLANMMIMGGLFSAPEKVSEIAEGIVGEPILAVYKGMSDAQKAGQTLSVEHYAQFIFEANETLKHSGNKGVEFSMKLAEQYAAENAAVSRVLAEVYDGRMSARIDGISAAYEAQKAQATDTQAEVSHVQRLTAPVETLRPEMGDFTAKLNAQRAAAMAPASPTLH